MSEIRFDPSLCADCPTVDCLTRCQYMDYGLDRAREEKAAINAGKDCRALHECLTCYACNEYCPNGNNPFYVLVAAQEDLGLKPAPDPITTEQLVMMDFPGRINRLSGRKPVVDMCAFPMLSHLIRGSLFENAEVVGGNDVFCNIMWLHFAKNSVIRERVPRAMENLRALCLDPAQTDELICFHDECYATYTSLAPAFGMKVPFSPVHLFDYLDRRLEALKDRIKPLGLTIAYQRPCSNRLIPETDAVLDRIFKRIGVTRAKRKFDRQNALCCGGVPRAQQRDELADEIQDKNLDDMKASGATHAVFNCPFCMATLAADAAEYGLMPVHVTDLCLMALGE